MIPKPVRWMILAFFLLSLAGLLLHLRIHPPEKALFNLVPLAFTSINAFLLPFLFAHPRTVAWAYILTWATVLAGSVGMAWYSIITWQWAITPVTLVLNSTLADILILAAKIPIARMILSQFELPPESPGKRGCVQ